MLILCCSSLHPRLPQRDLPDLQPVLLPRQGLWGHRAARDGRRRRTGRTGRLSRPPPRAAGRQPALRRGQALVRVRLPSGRRSGNLLKKISSVGNELIIFSRPRCCPTSAPAAETSFPPASRERGGSTSRRKRRSQSSTTTYR